MIRTVRTIHLDNGSMDIREAKDTSPSTGIAVNGHVSFSTDVTSIFEVYYNYPDGTSRKISGGHTTLREADDAARHHLRGFGNLNG